MSDGRPCVCETPEPWSPGSPLCGCGGVLQVARVLHEQTDTPEKREALLRDVIASRDVEMEKLKFAPARALDDLKKANVSATDAIMLASGWDVRWVALKKSIDTRSGQPTMSRSMSDVLDEIERLEREPYPPKEQP